MKSLKIVMLIAMIGLTETAVHAYENTTKTSQDHFWFGIGAGYSSPINSLPTIMAHATYGIHNHLLTLRYIRNAEFAVFQDNPQEKVNDFGFMYGRKLLNKEYMFISVSGGVSYLTGTVRGRLISNSWFHSDYESVKVSTIGFPLESQLAFTPFKHFGISVHGFGNLNPDNSYAGIGLSLLVGRLTGN